MSLTRLIIMAISFMLLFQFSSVESVQKLHQAKETLELERELLEAKLSEVSHLLMMIDEALQGRVLDSPLLATVKHDAPIYPEMSIFSKPIDNLSAGSSVEITSYAHRSTFWKVRWSEGSGYILTANLVMSDQIAQEREETKKTYMNALKSRFSLGVRRQPQKRSDLIRAKSEQERKIQIREKYGHSGRTNKIIFRIVDNGMSGEMVKDSWGEPNYIIRTKGRGGTDEMWAYDLMDYFLFFKNDRLMMRQRQIADPRSWGYWQPETGYYWLVAVPKFPDRLPYPE